VREPARAGHVLLEDRVEPAEHRVRLAVGGEEGLLPALEDAPGRRQGADALGAELVGIDQRREHERAGLVARVGEGRVVGGLLRRGETEPHVAAEHADAVRDEIPAVELPGRRREGLPAREGVGVGRATARRQHAVRMRGVRQRAVRDHDAAEARRLLRDQRQPDQAAPVLSEEHGSRDVELLEPRAHPRDVTHVAVVSLLGGLVAPAEPDEVRRQHAMSARDEAGDHLPVEIRPGRLAVQQQDRARAARALVDVVHAQGPALAVGEQGVVRGERVAGQVGEAALGRSQCAHQKRPAVVASSH
jgi:hypothetical protein